MRSLGRYDILDELGKGSMGVVYRARDPKINRTVAIKCIRPNLFDDEGEASQRFQQEMLALGRLIHPNIVTIFDAGEDADSGSTYIVMEFVEGKSLSQLLRSTGPPTVEQSRQIGIQICSALDFAHTKGVIHRDIKPGNILLSEDLRTVKVTDFGIARLDGMGMTQANRLLGTPQYMSPEQCLGNPVDGRSDLFAVGVILYELTTGQRPFPGESIQAVMQNILNFAPAAPVILSPQIPRGLSATVIRALEKDPARRFTSGKEMAESLMAPEAVLEGEEETVVISLGRVKEGPKNLQVKSQDISRRPIKYGLIFGWTLGVLAVLLLSYGGWNLLLKKRFLPPAETASVIISTDPDGATIQVDGVAKGISPLTLSLPGGFHELVATKTGYHSRSATIEVPPGEQVPIDVTLTKEEDAP